MFLTIVDANNVDILHTIIGDDDGMIENIDGCGLDQNNCWGGNMMGNSSLLCGWKGNFTLSQPTPSLLFGTFCFSLSRQQTAC